jgi:mono/diheme cytochrome c family protein
MLALLGSIGFLYLGLYNVAATDHHWGVTHQLLEFARMRSIKTHAAGIQVPPDLDKPEKLVLGVDHFAAHCAVCHGGPGVPKGDIGKGLYPPAPDLAHTATHLSDAEMFWVIKNGIKMTGMPAWEFRLADGDMWAVVAFLRELPLLSPEQYAMRTRGGTRAPFPTADEPHAQGDPKRGKVALEQYACPTCHRIPGVVGEHAPVGPPLDRIALRQYLAGVIQNTPDNLVQWLRRPQELHPRTAMPNLGVSERDARDMAAYLYTLR